MDETPCTPLSAAIEWEALVRSFLESISVVTPGVQVHDVYVDGSDDFGNHHAAPDERQGLSVTAHWQAIGTLYSTSIQLPSGEWIWLAAPVQSQNS